jgi:hypothetical protein
MTKCHKIDAIIVLGMFATLFSFAELDFSLFAQSNQIPVTFSNSLPSNIITTDGQAYKNVKLLRVLADGLLIEYLPDSSGTGLARLKFTKLSKSLQEQFGYDPQKASAYEKDQALAMTELSHKLEQDEKTRTTMLGELSRSLVYVKNAQPVVTYVYYDPAGPTPSQLGKEWKGSVTRHFAFDADFTVHSTKSDSTAPFNFHFDSVRISLGLKLTVTLPNGETGKLKEHEEGHQKIDEYFYSLGPQMAQRAGDLVTENELVFNVGNLESAEANAIALAKYRLQAEYLKYTQDPCEQANKYYDELTDHGRNYMDSDQAIQMAIHRYELQPPN